VRISPRLKNYGLQLHSMPSNNGTDCFAQFISIITFTTILIVYTS
jgi:hypothetical protein